MYINYPSHYVYPSYPTHYVNPNPYPWGIIPPSCPCCGRCPACGQRTNNPNPRAYTIGTTGQTTRFEIVGYTYGDPPMIVGGGE